MYLQLHLARVCTGTTVYPVLASKIVASSDARVGPLYREFTTTAYYPSTLNDCVELSLFRCKAMPDGVGNTVASKLATAVKVSFLLLYIDTSSPLSLKLVFDHDNKGRSTQSWLESEFKLHGGPQNWDGDASESESRG